MRKRKTLFIWDFHGVLEKDNEYAVQFICKKVLKEFGFRPVVRLKDVQRWYGLKWLEYFVNLTGERDLRKLRAMIERAREISREVVHKYLKPMDNAARVLAAIQKSGGENVVISNSRQDRIKHFLKVVGLSKYMRRIFGVDGHTSFKFNTPGEKAAVIRKISRAGDYAKKIIVGDSESDITAGAIAGVRTILFVTRRNREKVKNTRADRVVSNLREVLLEIDPHPNYPKSVFRAKIGE